MNLPTLENMHVSERTENIYAQIIAEEDIGESYVTNIFKIYAARKCVIFLV